MWYHNAFADSSLKLSTLAVGWMIRVLDPSRGQRFLSPGYPDFLWHPPSFQFNGYQGFSVGLMWLGHEIGPSPPPASPKIKNEWSYTSVPHICLHGLHRDNFTLLLFWNLIDSVHILQHFQPCQHCSHINVTSALYHLVS